MHFNTIWYVSQDTFTYEKRFIIARGYHLPFSAIFNHLPYFSQWEWILIQNHSFPFKNPKTPRCFENYMQISPLK